MRMGTLLPMEEAEGFLHTRHKIHVSRGEETTALESKPWNKVE
jgi:hypothetical protein